jgi:hypothetical protein
MGRKRNAAKRKARKIKKKKEIDEMFGVAPADVIETPPSG